MSKYFTYDENGKMIFSDFSCSCGLEHRIPTQSVYIKSGLLEKIPEMIREKELGTHCVVVCDNNTYKVAGKRVIEILERAGFDVIRCVINREGEMLPDETAVGEVLLSIQPETEFLVSVGSGSVTDTTRVNATRTGLPFVAVATAPSMDGYASATSSMAMDGLKVSLNSRCPDVIVGDTDILKNAPMHMLQAGLGDMLAKYISLAEWRIAHLITGEYYCERVAALVRSALDACVKNADGLLRRDETAVQAVFDGLIIGGVAMAFAGVSRPASGVEHYFSHVWDMRALEFGTPAELHGIQCAIGTLAAVRLYEKLRTMTPDAEKARAYVEAFDYEAWAAQLRAFLGRSGETMIALEKKEGKYRKDTHPARFARIQACWPEILRILDEELPSAEALSQLLSRLGMPQDASVIGVDTETMRLSFRATKDIRDKYVLSRLAWDLGVLDELCALL